MAYTRNPRRTLAICVLLAAVTLAAFWPVFRNDFINYDDDEYVTQNPAVRSGLTWRGAAWAFTAFHAGNWHPLTWLSHMLDCQLFDLNPTGHHAANLCLHTINALLLFLLLQRLTGATWRSAFVAGLFAVHPLHVESVAWIAERKDVLSTFFGLLSLTAYAKYAEAKRQQSYPGRMAEAAGATEEIPSPGLAATLSPSDPSSVTAPRRVDGGRVGVRAVQRHYAIALCCFALSLMSKPMLVTLPFLLLLLDYWPLGRLELPALNCRLSSLRSLLIEKWPFFGLTAASCVVTFFAQQHGGSVVTMSAMPVVMRLQNAFVACAAYLGKMLWPAELAVYYPHPKSIVIGAVIVGVILVIGVSAMAMCQARRRPWLAVGWFWYLGTLVPVIGLVQVGMQSMADRYTYAPLIGVFIAITWGIHDAAGKWPCRRVWLGVMAAVVLLGCAIRTAMQAQLWRDSETIFRHTLAIAPDNPVAHQNLGCALGARMEFAEAAGHFERAVELWPRYAEALSNWGFALAMQGKPEAAIERYRAALAIKPGLGKIHYNLGQALAQLGRHEEALAEFRAALQSNPDLPAALNDLAWALATSPDDATRNGAQAVALAERACGLTDFREALFVGTLAAAYAEAGRFVEAVNAGEQARRMAEATGQTGLAERNAQLLEKYRAGRAHREPAQKQL